LLRNYGPRRECLIESSPTTAALDIFIAHSFQAFVDDTLVSELVRLSFLFVQNDPRNWRTNAQGKPFLNTRFSSAPKARVTPEWLQ
jgi:hypothetical protein